jgi:hypothetical protein
LAGRAAFCKRRRTFRPVFRQAIDEFANLIQLESRNSDLGRAMNPPSHRQDH